MNNIHDQARSPAPSLAPIGYALGGLSLLAFVALLHHPVGHGREPADVVASIRAQATMDEIVHASLAAIFSLLAAAMAVFAGRLGTARFTVCLGLVAFLGALVLTVLAAMTDGFVTPAIAARCAGDGSPPCLYEALILLRLAGLEVEFLTRFSFAGIALAALAWSAALLTTHGVPRWAGVMGLASAAGQIAGLLLAASRLSPASLLPIFAAQVVWYLVVAVLMIEGRGLFGTSDQPD